jgi:hypothetical protein
MWKSVENSFGLGVERMARRDPFAPEVCGEPGVSQTPLHACSACAGDYEDPDRTAWTAEEEEEDLLVEKALEKAESGDEFPAQEA